MSNPMEQTPERVGLDGGPLSIAAVEAVARGGAAVHVTPSVAEPVARARAVVERAAKAESPTYGVNTGFGSLSRVRVSPERVREIQRNLVRSHAAGVGEPLPRDVVRAMLLILAASLARGRSGVRPIVIERILDLLNRDVTPLVPSRGSVGASGDLAPLAHASLLLIGEGEAIVGGKALPGAAALRQVGLEPIELEAKEGLALINGTHLMAAQGALAMADVARLQRAALVAAAMSIDACRATHAFLDPRLHEARRQPGQIDVAAALRRLLRGSTIREAHLQDDPRVQDPYSLRATPQVLGAAFDTLAFARSVVERELGAVTDNPLVFPDAGDVVSGGNFHGMPLAIALDLLPIALGHVAGISERRVYWLLAASDAQNPVPPYLSPEPGLHSGLMIAQYTAAACCNEIRTIANPASVGNIPTSAGMEDYNSMGVTAGHQARAAVDLATQVIAIELLVMAEALDHQRPLASGAGVEAAHAKVRAAIAPLQGDRPPAPDIATAVDMIRSGALDAPADGGDAIAPR